MWIVIEYVRSMKMQENFRHSIKMFVKTFLTKTTNVALHSPDSK